MSTLTSYCPECGAPLENVSSCRDYLDQMIAWDFQDFAGVGQIHHLTVLAYGLQHPSMYSRKGLEDAKASLKAFLTDPAGFAEHDRQNRQRLGSDVRDWKITGTPEDHGEYIPVPAWKMTAAEVVREGLPFYVENVKKWAESVLEIIEGK